MNLPVKYSETPQDFLGLHCLEVLRAKLAKKIESEKLTRKERRRAIREMNFLIDYARMRRVRTAVWQWQDEATEHDYHLAIRRQQVVNQLVLERKRLMVSLGEMDAKIAETRIGVMEQMNKLTPKDERQSLIDSARKELLRLKLRRNLSRQSRREAEDELAEQTLARARFQKIVRQDFPELEDEIMDDYDRRAFAQSGRQR